MSIATDAEHLGSLNSQMTLYRMIKKLHRESRIVGPTMNTKKTNVLNDININCLDDNNDLKRKTGNSGGIHRQRTRS